MTDSDNHCSVSELQESLNSEEVRVLDCSWYLPSAQIDVQQAYLNGHIPGAGFFDIDQICAQDTDLPHMLPSADEFAQAVSALGIGNEHQVIVYDSAGLFSAARVWWMFKVFGHQQVRVLRGGFPAWCEHDGPISAELPYHVPSEFTAQLDESLLVDKQDLIENCATGELLVLDARSLERFQGVAPEPRPGLPSGHMPHSKSLPFDSLLAEGALKTPSELSDMLINVGVDERERIVTSCGSGVTAAVIALAMVEAGFPMPRLYDGAWAEWASAADTTVLTGTD